MNNLFQQGLFQLHSGNLSHFKIECDTLTLDDWETLAWLIAQNIYFTEVIGIEQGGIPLAKALEKYRGHRDICKIILIVDDVLTTGKSMEKAKEQLKEVWWDVIGVVVFARGECPDWIYPIFQMQESFNQG